MFAELLVKRSHLIEQIELKLKEKVRLKNILYIKEILDKIITISNTLMENINKADVEECSKIVEQCQSFDKRMSLINEYLAG